MICGMIIDEVFVTAKAQYFPIIDKTDELIEKCILYMRNQNNISMRSGIVHEKDNI